MIKTQSYENRKFFASSYQQNDKYRVFSSFNRVSYRSNNAYQNDHQNRRQRKFEKSRLKMTTKMKEKFKIKNRELVKDDRYRSYKKNKNKNKNNERQNRYRYRFDEKNDDYKNKNKVKIFLTKKKSNVIEQENSDVKNYHQQSDDLKYFNSKNNIQSESNVENTYVNISMTMNAICRTCKIYFASNNALHKHIRAKCISKPHFSKTSIRIHFQSTELSIIQSKIDFNQNIETDYDFKN